MLTFQAFKFFLIGSLKNVQKDLRFLLFVVINFTSIILQRLWNSGINSTVTDASMPKSRFFMLRSWKYDKWGVDLCIHFEHIMQCHKGLSGDILSTQTYLSSTPKRGVIFFKWAEFPEMWVFKQSILVGINMDLILL